MRSAAVEASAPRPPASCGPGPSSVFGKNWVRNMHRPEDDDETREIPAGHESTVPRPDEDPAGAEDEESAAAIADCLKILDEVWPSEAAAIDELPREIGRFRI